MTTATSALAWPAVDCLLVAERWLALAAGTALAVTLVALAALVICRCLAARPATLHHGVLLAAIVVMVLAAPLQLALQQRGWGWLRLPQITAAWTAAETQPLATAFTASPETHDSGHLITAVADTANVLPPRATARTTSWLPSTRAVGSVCVWLWLAGCLLGLVSLGRDLVGLARFLRTLRPCSDPAAVQSLARAARAIGLRRQPRLCESPAATTPLVACGHAPVIVLPSGLTASLSPNRLFAIFAHEAAHVLRGDLWITLLQRAATIAFWWCPVVSSVNRRLADIREQICDDHVVVAQGGGLDLAEALLELAQRIPPSRGRLALGTLGTVHSASALVHRVERLLQRRREHVHDNRPTRLMLCCFMGVALAIVGGSTITGAADRPAAAAMLTPLSEGELAAVQAAHAWIASRQQADGSWTFESQQRPNPEAATALALLAFMGRGHTHRQGPYQKQFAKGLDLLVARVADDGGRKVATAGTMYAAGIVSLALCRAYELSRDEALATPAQATLDFLADAQDPTGGGWRYQPRQPGDTSASGWQVAALATGVAAELRVKPETLTGAAWFLDRVQVDVDGTSYGYAAPTNATPSCSAIGLVARTRTGWKLDDPRLGRGADVLVRLGPSANLYTDYHVSQLLHIVGGDRNKAWRAAVIPPLLAAQVRDGDDRGSWLAGFEKTAFADRLYCTTLATLILETPLMPRPPRPQ